LLGGPEVLAERLGVSRVMVRSWLCGALLPPKGHFFRVIDILDEAEPDSPTLQDKPKNESPRESPRGER
jgi:transcriptional regulator with XRE-family HTH domain